MSKQILIITLLALFSISAGAQQFWSDAPAQRLPVAGERRIIPQKERVVQLQFDALQGWLSRVPMRFSGKSETSLPEISIPLPDGSMQRFRLAESPVMAPDLQARYPEIRSFTGFGVDVPGALMKCDVTPFGFHGMILYPGTDAVFIDPYFHGDTRFYAVYFKKDYGADQDLPGICETEDTWDEIAAPSSAGKIAQGDCLLRRYRLALACTGEYATFHGGNKNAVMAAFTTSMNRINGVYERDLAITMEMVPNNDLLIFLDPNTDPYTNLSVSTMLGENKTTIDNLIGTANYDIGHVFGTNGGGIAAVGVVCTSNKAQGVTGRSQPVGDPFDIDYVSHEMGHQFRAGHTQNNSCQRDSDSSVEPGSGSTIMGYAGICAPNVQSNSDDYFHAINLQEMAQFSVTGTGNTCAVKVNTGNNAPVLGPTFNFVIPHSTPFALTASATDADGDPLTYCWEQMDKEVATMPPLSTNTEGPAFRSFLPNSSPTRYFPRLADLANNTTPVWEVLPAVARTMNFRVTVRDNAPGAGCTDESNATVTVAANAGPFVVTKPNDPGIFWTVGSNEEITWDVANTNILPVNVADVRITLSTDGGFTYPIVLAANTPNDGSFVVTVPNSLSTTCRVRVEGRNNIFFDISNQNFTIGLPQTPSFTLDIDPNPAAVCAGDTGSVQITSSALFGFNSPVALSLGAGLPAGATATFTPDTVAADGISTLTIIGLTPAMAGNYLVAVIANGDTIQQQYELDLTVLTGGPAGQTQLVTPVPASNTEPAKPYLRWTGVVFADLYELEVSTNPDFNGGNLLYNVSVADTVYQLTDPVLNPGTVYYWRVRPKNDCGTGAWTPLQAFQVGNADCDNVYNSTNVPIVITDSDTSTVSSIIDVPAYSLIERVAVSLSIAHTWVGDLSAYLISPTGDTFELFNRPGVPEADFGCSGDDLALTFSDAAAWTADSLEVSCNTDNPAIGGTFKPLDTLNALNGFSAQGLWRLIVMDEFEEDGGALLSWSLDFCFPQGAMAAQLLKNDTLLVGMGLSAVISKSFLEMQLNGTPAQGQFRLLTLPQHGTVRRNNTPLAVGAVFTQAEVNNGTINYLHNGNMANTDSFQFDVFDDENNAWLHNQTFNIRILPNTLLADLSIDQNVICAGDSSGVLMATASGAAGPYSYSLNGGTPQSSNVFSNLPAGTYTVVITGAFGFTATSNQVTLTNPTPVDANTSVVDDDVTVVGSGGTAPYEYSIDGANFQTDTVFLDLPNGFYTVTVRDANGCTTTKDVVVAVNTLIVSAAQSADVLCNGDSSGAITVSVFGGQMPFMYSLDGVNFQASNVFNNLPAGMYTITVSDNQGFTAETNTVTIDGPSAISVSVSSSNDTVSVNAFGGTGLLQYSIDGTNFHSDAVFTGLTNGTYTITVRDANGCTATETVDVSSPPPSGAVEAVQHVLCFGDNTGSIQLCIEGLFTPFMVSINDPNADINSTPGNCEANFLISNLGGGTYTIIISDAQGLTTTITETVDEAPPLTLTVDTNGDTILASGSGGTGAFMYSIDSVNFQSDPLFPDLPNGIYTVYAMDQNGCVVSEPGVIVTSSLIDLIQAWGFQVSPNPSQGRFQLTMVQAPANLRIEAFDATGRLLLQQRLENTSGIWQHEIDLTAQPAGLYWLRLSSEGRSGAVKILTN